MIRKGRCVKGGGHYQAGNYRKNRVKVFAGGKCCVLSTPFSEWYLATDALQLLREGATFRLYWVRVTVTCPFSLSSVHHARLPCISQGMAPSPCPARGSLSAPPSAVPAPAGWSQPAPGLCSQSVSSLCPPSLQEGGASTGGIFASLPLCGFSFPPSLVKLNPTSLCMKYLD